MRRFTLRFLSFVLISAAALSVLIGPVDAHAIILQSQPDQNAVLKMGDIPVEIKFNSRIDHDRSKLVLYKPDQSEDVLKIETNDRQDIVRARIADALAGDYRLRWQVLSVDGHITRGDITFSVKP